uniref:Uncharacterized protein n=1 Tax=Oryza brachyantha TaxID=4533 RepID=J3L787_ORYBR
MHANCCVGLENKVHDLRNVLADWKNYTSLPPPEKKTAKFSWLSLQSARRRYSDCISTAANKPVN